MDEHFTLWGQPPGARSVMVLPPGQHIFPFNFQLPGAGLSNSFEVRLFALRYPDDAVSDSCLGKAWPHSILAEGQH